MRPRLEVKVIFCVAHTKIHNPWIILKTLPSSNRRLDNARREAHGEAKDTPGTPGFCMPRTKTFEDDADRLLSHVMALVVLESN